jgi:hypothetical protein
VQEVARLLKIGGGLNETERHIIHTVTEAEGEIFGILRRHRAGRKHGAGNVDPLVFPKCAAVDDCRADLLAGDIVNPQLNVAIVKQQRTARRDSSRQLVGRRDLFAVTAQIANNHAERIAGPERNRRVVLQLAGTNLRSGEVLHDCDLAARCFRRCADARDGGAMRLPRAMREIQSEYVDACTD